MRNTIYILSLVCLVWLSTSPSFAQMDPTLTAMILEYTQKAKSQYNTQLETMAVETEGHVWLKQEVEATKNYQQQFDRYISTFMTENMGRLSRQIGDTPVNAVAVALHHNRNDIYVDIINRSIGIVNTIRQVCIDTKMTEKQRIELVFSIRPQLQQMNRKLAMLTKLVRCTTMAQVWYEIEYQSLPHREGKAGIVEECLETWRVNGQNVKPRR